MAMFSSKTQNLKNRNKMLLFMEMKEGSTQSGLGADVNHSKLGLKQSFMLEKLTMFAYSTIYSKHIKIP